MLGVNQMRTKTNPVLNGPVSDPVSDSLVVNAQERLHNFFNNRKPKDLKKRKLGLPGCSETLKSEASLDMDQQGLMHQQSSSAPALAPLQ